MKYPSRSKYGNTRTVVDNIAFDSKAESYRYLELKLLLKARVIKDLNIHPRFELLLKGLNHWGDKYGSIFYEADFSYYDNERKYHVVEDVKGMLTDVYKIKKKLFMSLYPSYKFIEVVK